MRTILIVAAALLMVACGSSPTAPVTAAMLMQHGELTITCGDDICTFSGTGLNAGTGCAATVTGTTSFRVEQTDAAKVPWTLRPDLLVRPGETAPFSASFSKKVFTSLVLSQWRSDTAFAWSDVACR